MNGTAGDPIRKLAVVGAGTMGSGIALAALLVGWEVGLCDVSPEVLTTARAYLEKYLARKGQLAALDRVRLTEDLTELSPSDLWIEAVPEDLELKGSVLGQIERAAAADALLATNTSTLSVTALAAGLRDPGRLVGMHFFNPAAVLPLVEVVRGAASHPEGVQRAVAAVERLGKTPVVVQDSPGFIVNRVARPFYGEALRLLGEGAADVATLDAIVESAAFPMGPFRLMDLIGVDVNLAAAQSVYRQTFFDPRYRPHLIQQQKVAAGDLGRKAGRGFYRYDPDGQAQGRIRFDRPAAAGAGKLRVVAGRWDRQVSEYLRLAGFELVEALDEVRAVVVLAGRPADLPAILAQADRGLPSGLPLFCQANDVTWSEMASWLSNPNRLVGFDALFLAEAGAACLLGSPTMDVEFRRTVEELIRSAGLTAVWMEDRPGPPLTRIVAGLVNEAAFAVEEGVADSETIDRAMQLGVSYPKGPLAWGQELGWGRLVAALDHLYDEYHEPRYRVAPALRRWARRESGPGRRTDPLGS